LKDTPAILTAGDLHLENFGTWRDAEGRLVWGVNDLDEAAVIPYAYDLVRLAASAELARNAKDAEEGALAPFVKLSGADAAGAIIAGYREGLNSPRPTLLDDQETWLRPYVACSDGERARFWKSKIDPLPDEQPADDVMTGFVAALPIDASLTRTMRRPKQGGGSLGRPRFVAVANWRGGRIVREAKSIVPSAWAWAHGDAKAAVRVEDLSNGTHRSPDPWLRINGRYIFRRLAADARKVDLAQNADSDTPGSKEANALKLLHAMGFDVGTMHATEVSQAAAITQNLDTRDPSWLHVAAVTAAHWVKDDYQSWCDSSD
jgi:hypothetical protein